MASQAVRHTLKKSPHYKQNGLKSYVHAMRKFNIQPTVEGPYAMQAHVEQKGKFGKRVGGKAHVTGHKLVKIDAATGESGQVPSQDVEQNSEYLTAVSIGTPAQTLNLDFDTGSADLWVFSTELPKSDQTSSHTIFNASKSSTWKATSGSTWKISYGDGSSASGDVGTDNVKIGDITVENQAVELAKVLSSEFASGAGDGLLGLAFGSINTVTPTPVQTPVENMISQQDISKSQELFTAFLSGTSGSSWYTFGEIDTTATGGADITYTPVDKSQGFWMFDSTTANVNGKAVTRSGNTAIADTGTTLCLVGDDVCSAFYGAISGAKQSSQQQGWVYPSGATLPTLELAVGGKSYTVNPEDIAFQDLGDGTIFGGVQSRGDMTFDIFGDVFLRSIYAIFDQGNTQFGAVQRAPSSGTSSTGTTSS